MKNHKYSQRSLLTLAAFAILAGSAPGVQAQPPSPAPANGGGAFQVPDYVKSAGMDYVQHLKVFGPDVQPVLPFKIVGNVYYVGTSNTGSYLITGPQGHILVDTGSSYMLGTLAPNIIKLGFNPKDIKYIVVSHAHFDHVQGLAYMQRLTGAQVAVMGPDVPAIESGHDLSWLHIEGWEPVKVGKVLKDGDVLTVGPVSLRAIWTPGHTQGMTSYVTQVADGSRTYTVLFGGPPTPFVGDKRWATDPRDADKAFKEMRALKPDFVLPGHPGKLFEGKLADLQAGTNPSPIETKPGEWQKTVDDAESAYQKKLAAAAAAKPAG